MEESLREQRRGRARSASSATSRAARRTARSRSSSTTAARCTADELLVAIGRSPNTDDLGLETVGLEPGKPIEVDDSMRATGRDWLYAIGDVNGRALLTHMGKYQARIAADVILGYASGCLATNADGARSPRVIFTDPQVAAVGYTLDAGPGRPG